MKTGPGILRALRRQLCPVWAALGAAVLFGFLVTGAAHDHAEDSPDAQAIHCPVVAGPIAVAPGSAGMSVGVDSAVFHMEHAEPADPTEAGQPQSYRARGPPAGPSAA